MTVVYVVHTALPPGDGWKTRGQETIPRKRLENCPRRTTGWLASPLWNRSNGDFQEDEKWNKNQPVVVTCYIWRAVWRWPTHRTSWWYEKLSSILYDIEPEPEPTTELHRMTCGYKTHRRRTDDVPFGKTTTIGDVFEKYTSSVSKKIVHFFHPNGVSTC